MPSGRSDESNESDGEFKEVNLSDQDLQTKNDDSILKNTENSEVLQTTETSDNNRNKNENEFQEKELTSEGGRNETENHLSDNTMEQRDSLSCSSNPSLQKYHSVISYMDEFQSTESTPRDPSTVIHHSTLNDYTIQQHLNEDNTEQYTSVNDDLVDVKQVDGNHDNDHEHDVEEHEQEEVTSSSNEGDEYEHGVGEGHGFEEQDNHSSGSESAESETNREKLQEGVPEFELSDHKSPDSLSEPAVDGAISDMEKTLGTDSKSKHRKKFRSTSKTFESLFHKSSIGKSSKSSKSKHSSTTTPTSPSTKDNLVVTTSTTTASSMKKKDKNPCWTNYEIPSKPGRKGPTLGVFYDSMKSWKNTQRTESGKDQKCIVLQTPDSLERYLHPFQVVSNYYVNQSYVKYYSSNVDNEDGVMNNYYYVNMMTQRKSLLPYYVTKTIFGNIPGMGRVLVCGTQCGKIIFHSFFTLDELLVLDTRNVYDRYLSRDNSIDSDSGYDMNKAIDFTLFEVNCLSLIITFQGYSTLLAIGNHLGHLLVYQVPKMQLVKLIYPANMSTATFLSKSNSLTNTFPSINTTTTYSTYNSICSLTSENEDVLIDELEQLRIKRYKNASSNNNNDNCKSTEDDVVFITCIGYCSTTGDLWVGYGNGTFAVYSNKFKLKCFYNSNHLADSNTSNIVINNDNVHSINNFEYCKYEKIVLVLYGNVKLEIFTFDGTFLSTISCTRLTNNTIPVSTIHVSSSSTNHSILYIGLMDGSLLIKKILYNNSKNTNNNNNKNNNNNNDSNLNTIKENVAQENEELDELLSNTIEFKLLYNLNYRFDGEVNFGAPVTSICPVPFQQLVLLGNASGGLSVISNLVT